MKMPAFQGKQAQKNKISPQLICQKPVFEMLSSGFHK